MTVRLRVTRGTPGAVWQAMAGDEAVGTARALVRPDRRTFVSLRSMRGDAYEPLLAAIAAEFDGALHLNVDLADEEAVDRLRQAGAEIARRESNYVIPVVDACASLASAGWPQGYSLVAADQVSEDALRELDDALRQDVPGTDGWQWDAEGFRDETYDPDRFDPALYWVAIEEATGDHVGLVRVWTNPAWPRLGLIAVLAAHRRSGLARGMLARVFSTLEERGEPEVTTEIDDTNHPSRQLLLGLGARRVGGFVEMIRPAEG